MKERILVLGAGRLYTKVLQILKDAGFFVIAVDRDPLADGRLIADYFKAVDFSDKEKILDFSRRHDIHAIMPINDFGVRTAAYVSAQMGLVGLNPKSAERACDKGLMRQKWLKDGLAIPKFLIVNSFQELKNCIDAIGFPCVLKPTDSGGAARGVSVIRKIEELKWAYDFALPYTQNSRLIIEEFMEGVELSVETISVDGKVNVLAIADKEKPDLRTRVTTGINYSANISDHQKVLVKKLVRDATLSIGIENGMGHTEVMLTQDGPKLIEIGARGGGGHIFHTIIEKVSGINAPVSYANVLLGRKPDISHIQSNGAVYRFFNPNGGIFRGVKHIGKAKGLNGVDDIHISIKEGQRIGILENGLQRIGFMVTYADSRNEAIAIANKVEEVIEFEIENDSEELLNSHQ